jgi:hypothetical protein
MIRDLKLSDLVQLEKNNYIPDLFNGPYKLIKTIEQDNEVISAFWARITVELSMVFKEGLSNLSKARAIDEAAKFLFCKVPEQLGISDAFLIFENNFDLKYINFLKKHYGYEEMKMVLRTGKNDAK